MKPQLHLRIVVMGPPSGVAFAMQRGRADLVAPVSATSDALVFEFAVSVADASSDPVRLTGDFAQGPASARFVYINSGTYAGQNDSAWSRRAKIPLAGITPKLVQSSLRHETLKPGGMLEARIAGVGRDGGPACATVPLLSAWSLVAT
jgi:hypothetical protein